MSFTRQYLKKGPTVFIIAEFARLAQHSDFQKQSTKKGNKDNEELQYLQATNSQSGLIT